MSLCYLVVHRHTLSLTLFSPPLSSLKKNAGLSPSTNEFGQHLTNKPKFFSFFKYWQAIDLRSYGFIN